MSGINEIKRKAKLSMDEMYDNQLVGKTEKKQTIKPETQKKNKLDSQPSNNISSKEVVRSIRHVDGKTTINQSENTETNPDTKQESQKMGQISIFLTQKQQTPKLPTYKMTFNLTADIYKAFNDLYANRILQGRKTEKSELISEAIQWLIQMEEVE